VLVVERGLWLHERVGFAIGVSEGKGWLVVLWRTWMDGYFEIWIGGLYAGVYEMDGYICMYRCNKSNSKERVNDRGSSSCSLSHLFTYSFPLAFER